MENNREAGSRYEEIAAAYLKENGLEILEHNFRNRHGEVDLIAKDGEYLVFIEVKYRSGDSKGMPTEAVTPYKQGRIRNVARHYLYQKRFEEDTPCRFDVVAIFVDEITWIKDAF